MSNLGAGSCDIRLDGEHIAYTSTLTVNGNIMTKTFFRQLPWASREVIDDGKFLGSLRLDEELYFPIIYKGRLYRCDYEQLNKLCNPYREGKSFKASLTDTEYKHALENKITITPDLKDILYKIVLSKMIHNISNDIPLEMDDVKITANLRGTVLVTVSRGYNTDVTRRTSFSGVVNVYARKELSKMGLDTEVCFDIADKYILYNIIVGKEFKAHVAHCMNTLVDCLDSKEKDTGDTMYTNNHSGESFRTHARKIIETNDKSDEKVNNTIKIKADTIRTDLISNYTSGNESVKVPFEAFFSVADSSIELIHREAELNSIYGTEEELIRLQNRFMSIVEAQRTKNTEDVLLYNKELEAYKKEKEQQEKEEAEIDNIYKSKMADALTRTIMIGRDLA